MFTKTMHVCPGMGVTNSLLYSTEEALKKLSDTMLFITCLHLHTTICYKLAAGMDHGAAILDNLSDPLILALPYD